jgi:hypothetical protein
LNISQNISKYVGSGQRKATGGEASFDFCFNYFQSFRRSNKIEAIAKSENIELSCLQIGFFLASWGMFRNSPLGKSSSKLYQRLIENLVGFDRAIWDIDVADYGDAAKVSLLIKCGNMIATSLGHDSDILRTKVMLAVFGSVPAFDNNFTLPGFGLGRSPLPFREENLKKILAFYNTNKSEIDSHQISTLDFLTGQPTGLFYPRAKIIDMIGYVEGGGPL